MLMKISSLISTIAVGVLVAVGSVSWARTDSFTPTHTALAAAVSPLDVATAPAHEALGRLGGWHRLFELASNVGATSNPCGPSPQSPRPVGQTNNKKRILSPATVPPCTPPRTKHG